MSQGLFFRSFTKVHMRQGGSFDYLEKLGEGGDTDLVSDFCLLHYHYYEYRMIRV